MEITGGLTASNRDAGKRETVCFAADCSPLSVVAAAASPRQNPVASQDLPTVETTATVHDCKDTDLDVKRNGSKGWRTAVEHSDSEGDDVESHGNPVTCRRTGDTGNGVEASNETSLERLSRDVETLLIDSNSEAFDAVDGASDNDDNDPTSGRGGNSTSTLVGRGPVGGRPTRYDQPSVVDDAAAAIGQVYQRQQAALHPLTAPSTFALPTAFNNCFGLSSSPSVAHPEPAGMSAAPSYFDPCKHKRKRAPPVEPTQSFHCGNDVIGWTSGPISEKKQQQQTTAEIFADRAPTASTQPMRFPSSADHWGAVATLTHAQSPMQTFAAADTDSSGAIVDCQAVKFRRDWLQNPQENDELHGLLQLTGIADIYNGCGTSFNVVATKQQLPTLVDEVLLGGSDDLNSKAFWSQTTTGALFDQQQTTTTVKRYPDVNAPTELRTLPTTSSVSSWNADRATMLHDDDRSSSPPLPFDDSTEGLLIDDNCLNEVAVRMGMPEYQIPKRTADGIPNGNLQPTSAGGKMWPPQNTAQFPPGNTTILNAIHFPSEVSSSCGGFASVGTAAVGIAHGRHGHRPSTELGLSDGAYLQGDNGTSDEIAGSISHCSMSKPFARSSISPTKRSAPDPMLSSTACCLPDDQPLRLPASVSPIPAAGSPSTDSGIVDAYATTSPMTAYTGKTNSSRPPSTTVGRKRDAGFAVLGSSSNRSGQNRPSISDSASSHAYSADGSMESNLFGDAYANFRRDDTLTWNTNALNAWSDELPSMSLNAEADIFTSGFEPAVSSSASNARRQPVPVQSSDVSQLRQSSVFPPCSSAAVQLQSSSSSHQCCQTSELLERRRLAKACSMVARLTREQLVLTDANGNNILHAFILSQQPPLAEALIYRLDREKLTSSMINQRNQINSTTPLWLAVITGQPSVVRLLVERKVKVNVTVHEMATCSTTMAATPKFCAAVHYAAASRAGPDVSLEVLKELVKAPDIDLRIADSDGRTALHCAVQAHGKKLVIPAPVGSANGDVTHTINSMEIIRLLISHGANIGLRDLMHQKTALHWAIDSVLASGSSIDLVCNLMDCHQQSIAIAGHSRPGAAAAAGKYAASAPGPLVARGGGEGDDTLNPNLIASSVDECDVISDAIVHVISAANSSTGAATSSIDHAIPTRLIDLLLEKAAGMKLLSAEPTAVEAVATQPADGPAQYVQGFYNGTID